MEEDNTGTEMSLLLICGGPSLVGENFLVGVLCWVIFLRGHYFLASRRTHVP